MEPLTSPLKKAWSADELNTPATCGNQEKAEHDQSEQ